MKKFEDWPCGWVFIAALLCAWALVGSVIAAIVRLVS